MNQNGMMGGQMQPGMNKGGAASFFTVKNVYKILAGFSLAFFFIPAFFYKVSFFGYSTGAAINGITMLTSGTSMIVLAIFMLLVKIGMNVILYVPLFNNTTTNFAFGCASVADFIMWIIYGANCKGVPPTAAYVFGFLFIIISIALAVLVFMNKLPFEGNIIAGFKNLFGSMTKPMTAQPMQQMNPGMGQPMQQMNPGMGQPMQQMNPGMAQPMMNAQPATPTFCPSCGAQLKPGTKFCGKCGAQV